MHKPPIIDAIKYNQNHTYRSMVVKEIKHFKRSRKWKKCSDIDLLYSQIKSPLWIAPIYAVHLFTRNAMIQLGFVDFSYSVENSWYDINYSGRGLFLQKYEEVKDDPKYHIRSFYKKNKQKMHNKS